MPAPFFRAENDKAKKHFRLVDNENFEYSY